MPIARTNGVEIYYELSGPPTGAPLLVVMGYGSQMTSWPEEFFAALIAKGFRLIRFDNRDVGLSHKHHGVLPDMKGVSKALASGTRPEIPYTLDDMADDAATLLDHLGIVSAHVMGASMGGMIAQLIALRRPDKVRSLISVMSTTSDPGLPRSDPAAQEALMAKPKSDTKEDVVAHAVRTRHVLASPAFPEAPETLAARFAANYDRSFHPEGPIRQWAAIMASSPRTERLKKLRVPALVLHGSADNLIKPEAGRHTADCIPGAIYHEIEGWGHSMPPSASPAVTSAMADFIARIEQERAEAFAKPANPGCCGAMAG